MMYWFDAQNGSGEHANILCSNFSPSEKNATCTLESAMNTRAYTIAAIRMVASSLGALGGLSIIVSVLVRRRVRSSEVHPIFMLSLADCMLALLWITGSVIWFLPYDSYDHIWCYALTLMTAILECVAVNLTVVYGLFAFFRINKTGFSGLILMNKTAKVGPRFTASVYALAWALPLVVVMVLFGATAGVFLDDISTCSCWCLPSILNVLPSAEDTNNQTRAFLQEQSQFLLGLMVVLAAHYVIGFVSLLVFYWKTLRKIRQIKIEHDNWLSGLHAGYGTSAHGISSVQGQQSQARKRIVLFLTVFIISGFFNLLIFIYIVFFLSTRFVNNQQHSAEDSDLDRLVEVERDLLYAQSITIPLQGFLNAIVYGWTRDDFVQEVVGGSYGSLEDYEQSPPPISPSDLEESDELISDNETAAED